MLQVLNRRWKYLTAQLSRRFESKADPRIQLEQTIAEAREQHLRLKDHATNMIANQKQTELQLHRALSELQRVNDNARRAVLMAEQAGEAGKHDKVASLTKAAEQFTSRIVTLEEEVENLKALHSQVSAAAEQAKASVSQNALNLQAKQRERQKLLSQLDQARLQERMNEAMSTMTESVDESTDVPSFTQVRDKIEARYAKAKGVAELTASETTDTADTTMLEIEAEARANDARDRLNQIKEQLGITTAATPEITADNADTPAITAGSAYADTAAADTASESDNADRDGVST